jgi:hypothetical protein
MGELTENIYKPEDLSMSDRAKESLVKRFKTFWHSLSSTDKKIIHDKSQLENILNHPILKLVAIQRPAAVLNLKIESFNDSEAGYICVDGNIDVYVKQFTHKVLTEFRDQVVQVNKRNLVSFKINQSATKSYGSVFSEEEQK